MLNSDAPIEINLGDALRHPQFDPHIRHLVLAVSVRGTDITIGELAEVIGLDPVELVHSIMAETVAAEVQRILNLDGGERGIDN